MFKVEDNSGNISTVYSIREHFGETEFLIYRPGTYHRWIWVDAKDYSPCEE
jgi:hypothetical protein